MRTDTSHITGRGRPGRSAKAISRWAIVGLVAVAAVIMVSAFFLFSPYMTEEALVDRVVPADEPAAEPIDAPAAEPATGKEAKEEERAEVVDELLE